MTKKIFLLAGLIVSANIAVAQSQDGTKQQRWQQFRQEFKAACGEDMQALCSTEEGRAKFKCLRSPANAPNLSEQCSSFLASHQHHKKASD